ncbi:MAG: hypothetical protein HYX49_11925 [Chloroflexi bacterium]|nr:hypothetical protein [Chloroflexota bacterium]
MTSPLDILKKPLVIALLAVIVGIVIGLTWAWAIQPPVVTNTTPEVMRADLQEDYLRMTIDSFRVNRNPNLAVQRWEQLGNAAAPMYAVIQSKPNGIDPAVITAYGQVIQAVKGPNALVPAGPASAAPSAGGPFSGSTVLITAVLVLLLVGGVAAFIFLRRLLVNRSTGEVTPTMQMVEINKEAAKNKTNFESLGVAPPITQNMTTYVLGDDLYDESFSIDLPGGDFLGEYGVGVSETIGIGDPKKVTALEIWLFDKNDIKTATKVLMSANAFADAGIRARLEAKGELIQVEPQKQIMLETETLQLLATVVDLQYGNGAMPNKSYFERLTLELALWPKAK